MSTTSEKGSSSSGGDLSHTLKSESSESAQTQLYTKPSTDGDLSETTTTGSVPTPSTTSGGQAAPTTAPSTKGETTNANPSAQPNNNNNNNSTYNPLLPTAPPGPPAPFQIIQTITPQPGVPVVPGAPVLPPVIPGAVPDTQCAVGQWPCPPVQQVYLLPSGSGGGYPVVSPGAYPYPPTVSTVHQMCVPTAMQPCIAIVPCVPYPGFPCPPAPQEQPETTVAPVYGSNPSPKKKVTEKVNAISDVTPGAIAVEEFPGSKETENPTPSVSFLNQSSDSLMAASQNILNAVPVDATGANATVSNATTESGDSTHFAAEPDSVHLEAGKTHYASKTTPGPIPVETLPGDEPLTGNTEGGKYFV